MILIDAVYINNSGGKVLLDFLIQEIDCSEINAFYLLDKRIENNIPIIKHSKNIIFLKASLSERKKFYKENSKRFSKVLCFGNLPPNIRLEAKVFTYFHQRLYIETPQNSSLQLKISFFLKRLIFIWFLPNTDYFLVQTGLMKNDLQSKFSIKLSNILTFPFYPECRVSNNFKRKSNSYVYISNAPPHKNHIRLIKAFCIFYDRYKIGQLTFTIGNDFSELLELIQKKQIEGYPIINIGFVNRERLTKIYKESEYLIYPSLAESFGLGLVEAIENGCKVIGADLPYTYEVCEPSIIFDPLDERSILEALILSVQNNVKPSVAKISNKIDELISYLK